jgi:PAS domain S-box-containing protein
MKPARTFLGRLLLLVVAVTLPWLVALAINIEQQRRTAESRLQQSAEQRSQLLAQEIDGNLARNRQLLDFLAGRPEIIHADEAACRSLLIGLVRIDPLLANAGFADATGRVVCTTVGHDRIPSSVARFPEFVAVLGSTRLLLGQPRVGALNGRLVMPMVRGVAAPDGTPLGVLVLMLDLRFWSESWARHAQPAGSTLMLENDAGTVIARYPLPAEWLAGRPPPVPEVIRALPIAHPDGVPRLDAATRLDGWGLTVRAAIPEDTVLAPARAEARRAALVLAGLAVLVCWLAWRLSRRLVAPLQHLAATARAVGEGEPSARASEALTGEFQAVAEEFNRMLDRRARAERQVKRLSGFLAALSRTQGAIIHRAPRDELLQEACAACVEAGQARVASAWLREGSALRAVAWAGPAEQLFGPMPALRETDAHEWADTLTGRALADGLPGLSNQLLTDPQAADWRDGATAAGVRAQAVYPLRCAGEVIGVLLLHVDEEDWFDQALVDLMGQLADELAFALDNLHREQSRLVAQQEAAIERRAAQGVLEAREHQLAGIVESAMDAIITIDGDQRIVMFNRAASEMFGLTAAEVRGRPLVDFVPEESREQHVRGLQAFVASGGERVAIGQRQTMFGLRANGERFPFEAAVSRQGEGASMTMTAVIRDLTERLAAEAAREARLLAEAASHAKTEFLSRMSHELRTPLNAMLGFAQLLADDPLEPLSLSQHRHLELMRDAGWHLLALIDDVLDVSRIEAGRLDLQLAAVPLEPLIDAALSVTTTLAARHRVRLSQAPDGQQREFAVQADPTRLRQVVLNLLSNGCKYNRPGGQVGIQIREDGEQLCIDVVDDGVGMSEEQLAHLFEPFNRLGREGGAVEGTGIGLHITRQLVLKMGGTIAALSAPGQGTRMSVCLPRAAWPAGLPALATGAAAGGPAYASEALPEGVPAGAVLYIEDNPVNLMLVEQFLRRWPAVNLVSADTGEVGLARLRAGQFDLVLLDMQLPDMHGTELLRRLGDAELRNGTPIVALSASAMPEAVSAALAAGASEYWTKPLNMTRLGMDLQRFLRRVTV